jgi:hypothetical protein
MTQEGGNGGEKYQYIPHYIPKTDYPCKSKGTVKKEGIRKVFATRAESSARTEKLLFISRKM